MRRRYRLSRRKQSIEEWVRAGLRVRQNVLKGLVSGADWTGSRIFSRVAKEILTVAVGVCE